MTPESAFQLGSSAAIVAWLMLGTGIFVSSRRPHRLLLLIGGRVVPLLLALGYVALLIAYWKSAPNNFSWSNIAIDVQAAGVKIRNWLFTMYGGRIRFATPMLWPCALGMVA